MKQKKTIRIPDSIRGSLATMADNAKMDWFIEDYYGRKTMPAGDVEALSCAFLADNLYRIIDEDVIDMYDFFMGSGVCDNRRLQKELIRRIREFDEYGFRSNET